MPIFRVIPAAEQDKIVNFTHDMVEMKGLSELTDDLSALSRRKQRKFIRGVKDLMAEEGRHIQKLMQQSAPRKTGRLAKSIEVNRKVTFDRGTGELTLEVGSRGLEYGKYLEWGTGKFNTRRRGTPYVIKPKNAKVLAFKGKQGKTVFAKQVVHPGIKPRPFIRPAMEEYGNRLEEKITEEVQRIILNDRSKRPWTKIRRSKASE